MSGPLFEMPPTTEDQQSLPSMDELIEILRPRCRGCFFALDNISAAREAERTTGAVKAREVAMNIGRTCVGWKDNQSPQESLAQETVDMGLRQANVIEKFCPLGGPRKVRK